MEPNNSVLFLKRSLDIMVGIPGTAAFLVAYPIIATLIKLESPGPALYIQPRVGLDLRRQRGRKRSANGHGQENSKRIEDIGGALFTILKFRTMHLNAENQGPQLCNRHGDPRITRLGRFLRSTHLDELPQFWNVLKGEMSFIGPRPERPHFTRQYFEKIPLYRERTRMTKPGLTGLSQITLGYDDSLESVIRKTDFDLAYRNSFTRLKTWIRLEIWIIAHTILYLIKGKPLTETAALPVLKKISRKNGSKNKASISLVHTRNKPKPIQVQSGIRNFLTIDVECWFHAHNLAIPQSDWNSSPTHVIANVQTILNILALHNTKATFFVLGWVANRYPEVVRMIDEGGHEIGTHGYHHEKITDLTPYQFEKDLEMSLNALARLTPQKIIGHRASNFSIVKSSLWALEILAKYGLEYDSSIFPIAHKRYGIVNYPNRLPHTIHLENGSRITEIPMSTVDIAGKVLPISGGGYLRLYPYVITDLFIRSRNFLGLPAMVYFHPWELDMQQKRRNVGALKTFQHYVNLDTTAWKINQMLKDFSFTSVQENLATEQIRTLVNNNPVEIRSGSMPISENVDAILFQAAFGKGKDFQSSVPNFKATSQLDQTAGQFELVEA